MTLEKILEVHPEPSTAQQEQLIRCVGECFNCAASCASCADACLAESDLESLVSCICLNLDCADICDATGRVLARQTTPEAAIQRAMLIGCAEACRACAKECERHAPVHEHCRICAEACRRCGEVCNEALSLLS